jgi:hypothetical protein
MTPKEGPGYLSGLPRFGRGAFGHARQLVASGNTVARALTAPAMREGAPRGPRAPVASGPHGAQNGGVTPSQPSRPPQTTPDAVLAALRAAPVDDEPLTDEDRAAIERGREDSRAGRVVTTDELRKRLGL